MVFYCGLLTSVPDRTIFLDLVLLKVHVPPSYLFFLRKDDSSSVAEMGSSASSAIFFPFTRPFWRLIYTSTLVTLRPTLPFPRANYSGGGLFSCLLFPSPSHRGKMRDLNSFAVSFFFSLLPAEQVMATPSPYFFFF